jgi:hypothetical protein
MARRDFGGCVQSDRTWPNLASMMFSLAGQWPDKPMLRVWRGESWRSIKWGEFGRMAASCARHLRAVGVAAGDRVVLCMENRPEFPVAETALLAIRAVPVPAYTTNTVDDHAHLLRDSGARAVIVSSAVLADRLLAAAAKVSGLDLLVVMDGERLPHAAPQVVGGQAKPGHDTNQGLSTTATERPVFHPSFILMPMGASRRALFGRARARLGFGIGTRCRWRNRGSLPGRRACTSQGDPVGVRNPMRRRIGVGRGRMT